MPASSLCAGIHNGPVSIKANSNVPLGQTPSFLIPISNGDGSRRGVSQAHPALGSQALASPALPAGSAALQGWFASQISSPGHPAATSAPSRSTEKSEGTFSP